MLGESVHTMKKKRRDLVVTSKGIILEVNGKKTKYMVMSRDENIPAGKNHDIQIINKFFEKAEILQIFRKTVTYLFTYLLPPWSRVLLEKLTVCQLVKKFPAFYGTQRFITAFTFARHRCVQTFRRNIFTPFFGGEETGVLDGIE
jgi:hypothetical protein